MLRFIELKTGYDDNGPAWIGHVQLSRSGRTLYFNGKAFKRGSNGEGNHIDIETGEGYWISGIKRNGKDRHSAGSGKIIIEASAVNDYLKIVGATSLDLSRFVISNKIKPPDPTKSHPSENMKL